MKLSRRTVPYDIIGRISLWLESVIIIDDLAIQRERIQKKKQRSEEIDNLLSEDLIEERKQSIINRLSVEMTKWAKELQLGIVITHIV